MKSEITEYERQRRIVDTYDVLGKRPEMSEIIHSYIDGFDIETDVCNEGWMKTYAPKFDSDVSKYRVARDAKKPKSEHLEAILEAHREGRQIQGYIQGVWVDVGHPLSDYTYNLRVKPEPKVVYVNTYGEIDTAGAIRLAFSTKGEALERSSCRRKTIKFVEAENQDD